MTDNYIKQCPVGCTAALEPTHIELSEGALRRCDSCGQLVSATDEARYRQSLAVFDTPEFNQTTAREAQRRDRVALRRLDRTARLLGKPPAEIRMVDIGCSRGQFVNAAARAGFNAEGVEPAPDVAATARKQGLKVHTGLLEDQHYPDALFDAASLFEVVEHLREPLPLLNECRRILKPGAVLLVSTGNAASWTAAVMGARWDYFHMAKIGGHISFFNPHSLTQLAGHSGFRLERIETARVKFHEKSDVSRLTYTLGKFAAECLNVPARLCGRGHDMLAYLRRV